MFSYLIVYTDSLRPTTIINFSIFNYCISPHLTFAKNLISNLSKQIMHNLFVTKHKNHKKVLISPQRMEHNTTFEMSLAFLVIL
jgi:hypothetical protein